MTATEKELLQAVELALRDEWEAAHRVVQQHDGNATASWIHAVLHQIEGDLGNSRYWYRRAGKPERAGEDPRTELAAIRAELESGTPA
jgi:hypothetical protein